MGEPLDLGCCLGVGVANTFYNPHGLMGRTVWLLIRRRWQSVSPLHYAIRDSHEDVMGEVTFTRS